MSGLPGLLAADKGLRGQGEPGDPEYGRQYLLRAGGGGNGQEPLGAFRQGAAEAPVDDHQPAGHLYFHQYPAGFTDSGFKDQQPDPGYVRRRGQ